MALSMRLYTALVILAAIGCQDNGDEYRGDTDNPVARDTSGHLVFRTDYVNGATCGEVRGDLPGMNWHQGRYIAGNSDWLRLADDIGPGTYRATYLGYSSCASRAFAEYADFGDPARLSVMSRDARSYVDCNWWDASARREIKVAAPSCCLRFVVTADGKVLPAGNMETY